VSGKFKNSMLSAVARRTSARSPACKMALFGLLGRWQHTVGERVGLGGGIGRTGARRLGLAHPWEGFRILREESAVGMTNAMLSAWWTPGRRRLCSAGGSESPALTVA